MHYYEGQDLFVSYVRGGDNKWVKLPEFSLKFDGFTKPSLSGLVALNGRKAFAALSGTYIGGVKLDYAA